MGEGNVPIHGMQLLGVPELLCRQGKGWAPRPEHLQTSGVCQEEKLWQKFIHGL